MFPKASSFLSSSVWFSERLCIIATERLLLTAMFFILEHCQNRYIHKDKKQLKCIACWTYCWACSIWLYNCIAKLKADNRCHDFQQWNYTLGLFFFNNLYWGFKWVVHILSKEKLIFLHEFIFSFCVLTNIIALYILNGGGRY